MSKFKHNKKRNTAFLYEILLLEMSKTVLSNDAERRNKILKLIKEFFVKNVILSQELKLFKNLDNCGNIDSFSAEKILIEVKKMYGFLNQQKLFDTQNDLIKQMKEMFGENVLSNFVPNYRSLATISQIFNKDVPIKTRVLLEQNVVNNMVRKSLNKPTMVPVNNLVVKSFISKFNEQYKTLSEEQQKTINKFIFSYIDNGLEFKVFLNEEVSRLKTELQKIILKESDENTKKKIQEVFEHLKICALKENIQNDDLATILKVQNLIKEANASE